MGEFKFDKKQQGAETLVSLHGSIDEDAQFSSLDISKDSALVVDLNGVKAINSCGIREWIKWIRTAPASGQLKFKNCPKVIIDQVNMVTGFIPEHGKIESFYVPYYSDKSGNEKMILFRDGHEFKGSEIHAPSDVKDEEGEAMEMDVIEAKYFKFLKK